MLYRSPTQSRYLLPALALAVFTFSASTLHADQHEHQKNDKPAGNMEMGESNGVEQSNRMSDALKLNDKQRELFRNAMGQRMSSMRSGMDMQDSLRELTQSDNYDEKKVRELLHKHNQAQEDKIVSASKAMNEFYKSLSAEQKTKLKEMHEKKNAQMKEHMREQMKGHKMDHMKKQDENEDSGKPE